TATRSIIGPMGSLIAASREGALSAKDTFNWTMEEADQPWGRVTRFQIKYTGPESAATVGNPEVEFSVEVNGEYESVGDALAALGTVATPAPRSYAVSGIESIHNGEAVGFDA